ncbi:MAG TPA: hypothetical protein VHU15_14480 [Stellaceae bacterium]|nr:hypothetical protein [Stellaceae bacterium]
MTRLMFCRPAVTAGILALAGGIGLPEVGGAAQSAATAVTCINPINGASWQIAIDYGNDTVDSYPARITAAEIAWFDAKDGGNYKLDRQSGNFTAIIASSTGGYFRRGHCDVAKTR